MDSRQFIGLDVGRVRTGLAQASTIAKLAQPLAACPTDEVIGKINELDAETPVEALVIGLPRSLDGQETKQTAWVREWVEDLKSRLSIPVYAQDEAGTTKLAEAEQMASRRPHDADALAAAIILQDFLDTPETGRVIW